MSVSDSAALAAQHYLSVACIAFGICHGRSRGTYCLQSVFVFTYRFDPDSSMQWGSMANLHQQQPQLY